MSVREWNEWQFDIGVQMSETEEKWKNDAVITRRLREEKRELRPLGLIEARGACLYWAIADAMVVETMPIPRADGQRHIIADDVWKKDWKLREASWRMVKKLTLDTMAEHPYWVRITRQMGDPISKLWLDDTFGNHPCVQAACEALRVNVQVVNSGEGNNASTRFQPMAVKRQAVADKKPTLVLVNWEDRHYGSTRPAY